MHISNSAFWKQSPCSHWCPQGPAQRPCHERCVYLQLYSQTGHGRGPHTQAPPNRELQWGFNSNTALDHLGEYKNKRGGQEDKAPIRPVPIRTASTYTHVHFRWEEEEGQTSHFICHSHHHRHPIRSHSSQKTDRLSSSNRKTDFREEIETVWGECKRSRAWRRRARGDRERNSSQGKMESIFQLGGTFSHARSGLNS